MARYAGFDTEKVAALQQALGRTPDAASTLVTEVHHARGRVETISVLAAGLNPHQLGLDRTEPPGTVPGLSPVSTQAGDMSAEIQRRLAHLRSCRSLAKLGFHFDDATVFADLPAMDATRLRQALDDTRAALAQDDPQQAWALYELVEEIHGLNAGETDALVGQLTDAELADWSGSMQLPFFGSLSLFPDEARSTLANDLFSRLGEEQRLRVSATMPGLQPWLDSDHLGKPFLTLPPADIGSATLEDITQGEIGDCWFLASLAAELRSDPRFVGKHMVANDNGTYTVTFYQDGKAVPVTVDASAPANFAHGGPGWDAGPSWVAIYEKAFAQFSGGYGDIEGGWGDEGMEALTGSSAVRLEPGDLSLDELKEELDAGTPITAGTKEHTTGHLWWKEEKEEFDLGDDTLISLHEYTVVGVDTDHDPPRVTLRNPWGSGVAAPVDEFVTIDYDEFTDGFNELSLG